MNKRLYRSRDNKMIAGICGGIADYFNVDPVMIRIIFLVLLLSGVTPLIYVILWIIIPKKGSSIDG